VARIPDGGTQPHFLVLTQMIFFYNLLSFPPAPMKIVVTPQGQHGRAHCNFTGQRPFPACPSLPSVAEDTKRLVEKLDLCDT